MQESTIAINGLFLHKFGYYINYYKGQFFSVRMAFSETAGRKSKKLVMIGHYSRDEC